jgi:intracellular sulfur oxidation DsrE/DsrF family protein
VFGKRQLKSDYHAESLRLLTAARLLYLLVPFTKHNFSGGFMHSWMIRTASFAMSIGLAGFAFAQPEKPLPISGTAAAKEVPHAKELPDPNMTYKVLFDVAKAASKPDEVNPTLDALARYLNTLDKWGVPADHRKLAVIFHQGGGQVILKNDVYKERTGHDNPNIALLKSLKKAGVELHVCGQGLIANKVDPSMVLPEVDVDLWALVSIVNFEMRGYARIGN